MKQHFSEPFMVFYKIQFNCAGSKRAWMKGANWGSDCIEIVEELQCSLIFQTERLPDFEETKKATPFIYDAFQCDREGQRLS
jgi:hypothetical protein